MSQQKIPLLLSVAILAVASIVILHVTAQTDSPPIVTIAVQPEDAGVGYRAGYGAYYTFTASDDVSLVSAAVTYPSENGYKTDDVSYRCVGSKLCDSRYYVRFPTSGVYSFTVTAKDNSGQETVKMADITAPACTKDADCGTEVKWLGYIAQSCAEVAGGWVIKGGAIVPICKGDGTCDGSEKAVVKETCAAGQVCAMKSSDTAACISTLSSLVPRSASASTLPVSSFSPSIGASSADQITTSPISSSVPAPSVTTPVVTPAPPAASSTSPSLPSLIPPKLPSSSSQVQPLVEKASSAPEETPRKLSPKDVKKWQLDLRRELRKFERFLLKQGKTVLVSQVGDLREELYDLDPDDPLAGKAIQNLQEELAELRLIADAVPITGQGTVLKSGSSSSAQVKAIPTASSQPAVTQKASASPIFSLATSITITYPREGSTLRGFTNIDVALQNASEASGLQFQVDGVNIGGDENGKPPYGKLWLTRNVANGAHELRVMAWDAKGNTVTSNPVQVIVQNVPDTVPPTMSMPKVTAVTRTTATIQWTTDEPVGTSINYKEDLGGGYGRNHSAIRNYREKTTQHEVILTGLRPGTKYSYSVSVSDDAGNSPTKAKDKGGYEGTYAERYRQFTTLSNSPLVIFNFHIKDVTQTSATLAWTTSVPANAELQWESSMPPMRRTTLTTEHTFTLTDLKPFIMYHFRIRSEDALGNVVQVPPPGVDYRDTYFQTQEIPNEAPEISTNVHRTTRLGETGPPWYAGGQAYFTVMVKDDRPLQVVKVWLRTKKGKVLWEMVLPQCSGKTSCEDRNHPFTIPEELGEYRMEFGVQEMPLYPPQPGSMRNGGWHALTVVPCPSAKCE